MNDKMRFPFLQAEHPSHIFCGGISMVLFTKSPVSLL